MRQPQSSSSRTAGRGAPSDASPKRTGRSAPQLRRPGASGARAPTRAGPTSERWCFMSWISLRGRERRRRCRGRGRPSSQRPQFTQASRSSRLFQLNCSIVLDAEASRARRGRSPRAPRCPGRLSFPLGPEVAEEDVREAEEDVAELPVHQVADEAEGGRRVEPPREAVEREERLRVERPAGRARPAYPTGDQLRQLGLLLELGDGDPNALDEEALEEDQQQQRERDPVVQRPSGGAPAAARRASTATMHRPTMPSTPKESLSSEYQR